MEHFKNVMFGRSLIRSSVICDHPRCATIPGMPSLVLHYSSCAKIPRVRSSPVCHHPSCAISRVRLFLVRHLSCSIIPRVPSSLVRDQSSVCKHNQRLSHNLLTLVIFHLEDNLISIILMTKLIIFILVN